MQRDSRESELKRNGAEEWVIPSVCQLVLVPRSLRRETPALKAVARGCGPRCLSVAINCGLPHLHGRGTGEAHRAGRVYFA